MKIEGFDDTIKWYDDNAEQYAKGTEEIRPDKQVVMDAFLGKLPNHPSVLEAGCGAGRHAKALSDKGAKVVGLDLSAGLIKVAQERYPGIEFVEGNLLELPLEDVSVDGVWSNASLVHFEKIEEVQKVLKEFHRVLKPGGSLYVYVKQQQGEEKTAIVNDTLSNHERFFRYYEASELAGLLKEAGFTVGEYQVKDDSHGRDEVKWLEFVVQKLG